MYIEHLFLVVKASGTFYPLSTIPTEQHSPENSKNISGMVVFVGFNSNLYGGVI